MNETRKTRVKGSRKRATAEQVGELDSMVAELTKFFGTTGEVSSQAGLGASTLYNRGARVPTVAIYEAVRALYDRVTGSADTIPAPAPTPRSVRPASAVRDCSQRASRHLERCVQEILCARDGAENIARLGFEHLADELRKLDERYLRPLWE
jgi:hypothetical protein